MIKHLPFGHFGIKDVIANQSFHTDYFPYLRNIGKTIIHIAGILSG